MSSLIEMVAMTLVAFSAMILIGAVVVFLYVQRRG